MRRLTVAEAAEAMGITTDAVRMRISRGTLDSERQEGRVYVLLEDDATTDASGDTSGEALIASKDETIRVLREQLDQANEANRENRRIIAALTSRLPAIEAPQEPSEAPERAADATHKGDVPGDQRESQEAQEARVAGHKKWEHRLLLVLGAIGVLSAVLYLALAVLAP
jgi:hypothetical protein